MKACLFFATLSLSIATATAEIPIPKKYFKHDQLSEAGRKASDMGKAVSVVYFKKNST